MKSISIRLAGPPMAKERVRITKLGKAYTPARTVNYEARLAGVAQQAMGDEPPFAGPVAVTLVLTMPVADSWSKKKKAAAEANLIFPTRKPDLDNVSKLLDALNMIVWVDDGQVVDIVALKRYGAKPGLEITVETLDGGL